MRFIKAFGAFWYDFIIGDDWKIAVAVVLSLAITGAVMAWVDRPAARSRRGPCSAPDSFWPSSLSAS